MVCNARVRSVRGGQNVTWLQYYDSENWRVSIAQQICCSSG
jgi:hypothetical protein